MTVFITGVCGFIGRLLAVDLSRRGHRVCGSTSRPRERAPAGLDGPPLIFRFGDMPRADSFRGVDTVVHLAHDRAPGRGRDVIEGTIALADAGRRAGTTRQLFVSSLSARPDATSEYGRTKLELESCFRHRQDVIVRPGTVVGNGGVFVRLIEIARRYPVLPLPDGGRTPLPVIGTRSLCHGIARALEVEPGPPINLFYPEMPTLREIMTAIGRALGKRRLLLPFPSSFLLGPLALLERIGLRLPIDTENLRGYGKARTPVYTPSTQYLDRQEALLDELIRESLEGG